MIALQRDGFHPDSAEGTVELRSDDFLNVAKHPTATFESTSVKPTGDGTADIAGNLTLNGVTKPVVIAAKFIGEGKDPWGGYRAGFEGSTTPRSAKPRNTGRMCSSRPLMSTALL